MTGTTSRGQLAAAISNAMVGIHSRHYGKGPTKAKTYLMEDVVVTVMRDVFTTVERTLIDHGKGDLVRDVRTAFQYTMREEFKDSIRQIMGREPHAFISQIDCDAGIAVEVFLLSNGETDLTQDGASAS